MSDTLEKRGYCIVLYDIYGGLLTAKQQQIFELYYQDDYSLGEIAEEMGISRQAIYDTLKRTVQALDGYEQKLHLAEKELEKRKILTEISDRIKKLQTKKEEIRELLVLLDTLSKDKEEDNGF